MKTIKIIFCITIWLFLGWLCLSKLSQGIHDENLISQMPQRTYDEIVDTLTSRNGFQSSKGASYSSISITTCLPVSL